MKFIDLVGFICNILKTTAEEDFEFFNALSQSEIQSIYYSKVMDCFLFVFEKGRMIIKNNHETGEIDIKSSLEKPDSDRKDGDIIN